MSRKIVLVKNIQFDYESVLLVDDFTDLEHLKSTFVIMTEVMEVEFKELPHKEIVAQNLKVIDEKITEVQAQATAVITQLTGRRNELLAVEHLEADDGLTKE